MSFFKEEVEQDSDDNSDADAALTTEDADGDSNNGEDGLGDLRAIANARIHSDRYDRSFGAFLGLMLCANCHNKDDKGFAAALNFWA
jgi:hypothetical protein